MALKRMIYLGNVLTGNILSKEDQLVTAIYLDTAEFISYQTDSKLYQSL